MLNLQTQQNNLNQQQNEIMKGFSDQQRKSSLPTPQVPMFDGDPVEYDNFIRAFENIIETKVQRDVERLYYLEQYTVGDVLHTSNNDFPSNVKNISKEDKATSTMDGNSTVAFTNSEISAQNYSLAGAGKTIIARAIVPVKVSVKGRSESVTTYAFLDNGSDSTFCTETLAQQLGVKGKEAKISLTIMEKTNSLVDCSIITNLTVSDLDENSLISLPVMFTTKEIPIARREIPNQDGIDEWSYLRDVHLPELDAEIGLLVGSDVPQALEPIEFRNIQHGGPYATRTVLGWTINGPLSRKKDDPNVRNFFVKSDIHLSQVVENAMNQDFTDKVPHGSDSSNFFAKSETPLNDIVLDSINRDFNERAVYDKKEMSQEEQQFMSKVKRTVSLKNGHYQIALPFKDEHPQIPRTTEHKQNNVRLGSRNACRKPLSSTKIIPNSSKTF